MAEGWTITQKAWGDEFEKDGLDSHPLELKCRVNNQLHSQSFLHEEICGDEERVGHLNDPRVLYITRKLLMIFQRHISDLKLPTDPFSPGCLVLPCVFVRLSLSCFICTETNCFVV